MPFICNYTNFANYLFKLVEEYDTGGMAGANTPVMANTLNTNTANTKHAKHKYV